MAQTVLNLEGPTSTTHTLLAVLIFVILLDKLSLHVKHKWCLKTYSFFQEKFPMMFVNDQIYLDFSCKSSIIICWFMALLVNN